jgi:hypothetical protein
MWHDIKRSRYMLKFVKYFFLQGEGETAGFKLGPAVLMMMLFLLFQAAIGYILITAWLD